MSKVTRSLRKMRLQQKKKKKNTTAHSVVTRRSSVIQVLSELLADHSIQGIDDVSGIQQMSYHELCQTLSTVKREQSVRDEFEAMLTQPTVDFIMQWIQSDAWKGWNGMTVEECECAMHNLSDLYYPPDLCDQGMTFYYNEKADSWYYSGFNCRDARCSPSEADSFANVFVAAIAACTNRMIMTHLIIHYAEPSLGQHANMLLWDADKKTVERFDPNGGAIVSVQQNAENCVDAHLAVCAEIAGYDYAPPHQICPSFIGPQFIEDSHIDALNQDVGYCGAWSFFYMIVRAWSPDIAPQTLIETMTRLDAYYLRRLIRAVASFIAVHCKNLRN